jgi:hypothetical protein
MLTANQNSRGEKDITELMNLRIRSTEEDPIFFGALHANLSLSLFDPNCIH